MLQQLRSCIVDHQLLVVVNQHFTEPTYESFSSQFPNLFTFLALKNLSSLLPFSSVHVQQHYITSDLSSIFEIICIFPPLVSLLNFHPQADQSQLRGITQSCSSFRYINYPQHKSPFPKSRMLLWTHWCPHIAVTLSITAALQLPAGNPVLGTHFTSSGDSGDISVHHCPMQSFICLIGDLKRYGIRLSSAYFWEFCIFLIFAVKNNLSILKKKSPTTSHYFSRDSLLIN